MDTHSINRKYIKMKEKMNFDYKDVVLVPKKGIVDSRSECDTTCKLGNFYFKSPVIPANMQSIINEEIAIELASNNYFYIMHRFEIDSYAFTEKMKKMGLISSISIGVGKESYSLLKRMVDNDIIPDYITIDIAHGHSIHMEKLLTYIKDVLKINSFIIAGNVSTLDGILDLDRWGADAIKFGIAGGEACITYHKTAFGSRYNNASSILEVRNSLNNMNKKVILIADGGIRQPGHIAVSINMGSDMVMVGGMLSAHIDSPGEIIEKDGIKYKKYWGSASESQSGKTSRIEGKTITKELKNLTVLEEMDTIVDDLQSAISYSGGKKLKDIYSVEYKIVSK